MTFSTSRHLRSLIIYSINVRTAPPSGTFMDVKAMLPALKRLGVDMIWLLPVHPTGIANRKGTLGSPYSIRDYKEIESGLGGESGFRALLDAAHNHGVGIMVDAVLNHCAIDNPLTASNPGWFVQEGDGRLYVASEGWTDIVGFDHRNASPGRDDFFLEYFRKWARLGVDGFRCDFASAIPLAFWRRVRREVSEINSEIVWLAESVQPAVVGERRSKCLPVATDGELFEVFDISYSYDVWPTWQACISGLLPTKRYCEALRWQDLTYPEDYVKLRFVENHDLPRILSRLGEARALAWTAFEVFNKGAFLVNAGQEHGEVKRLSLFDFDRMGSGRADFFDLFRSVLALKKEDGVRLGQFVIVGCAGAIQAAWECFDASLYGVFNVGSTSGEISVELPDGLYEDVLSRSRLRVLKGRIEAPHFAAVLRYHGCIELEPLSSPTLDFVR